MVNPTMIGSAAGMVCGWEIAGDHREGSRKKNENGFFGRPRAAMVMTSAREGQKAKFEPCGVDLGRKGRRRRGAGLVLCEAEGGQGGGEGGGGVDEITGVVDGMQELLNSEQKDIATQVATDLVARLDLQGREALLSALYRGSLDSYSDEDFKEADTNLDGIIDQKEFATYAEALAIKYGNYTKPLTSQQMFYLFTKAAVGMVGFGFTDNAIMIIAGDAIQNSIGATLGLTTLLSAGLGNAVADVIGTAFRGYIERLSGSLMRQDVTISAHQMKQKEAWWAETVGASCGVTVGCLLGLAPLFLLHKKEDASSAVTKFASISSSTTTASVSFFSPLPVASAGPPPAVAADDALECCEHATQVLSLSTGVEPALTPPLRLRSFQSTLLGTPLLLLSVVVFMACRRVVNYRKAFGLKK